jgi:hypothetical protein
MHKVIEYMILELDESMSDRDFLPTLYWNQYHLEDLINLKSFEYPSDVIRNYVIAHNDWAINWVVKNNLHHWNKRKNNSEYQIKEIDPWE